MYYETFNRIKLSYHAYITLIKSLFTERTETLSCALSWNLNDARNDRSYKNNDAVPKLSN